MFNQNVTLRVKRERDNNITAYVFLLPILLILIVFVFYPIVDTFVLSGYKWNGISAHKKFIGLYNWSKLLSDQHFWAAFRNNIEIMILSILIQLPIGIALATFIEFGGKKCNIFKVVWFIPMLISSVAIGFLFTYLLSASGGVISSFSNMMGGSNIDLLGNPKTVLITIILIMAWRYSPFYMVYIMAAYTNISTELFEASTIDGATKLKYFRFIALPLLSPAIASGAILSLVGSLKYFDLVYVMTQGGPGTSSELMATYMYKLSFENFNMGYGSAVASGMFILISTIALVTYKFVNKKEN